MIIGIDVDGVLADLIPAILKRTNKKYGKDMKKRDISYWDYNENGYSIFEEIKEASKDQDFIWAMKPIETSHMMNFLSDIHYIKIVTSRFPPAKKTTFIWLTKYFQFDEVVWTHGKQKTNDYIKVNILIDDYIGNLKKFIDTADSEVLCGILYDQPWSGDRVEIKEYIDCDDIFVCKNWHEINHVIDIVRRGRTDG